MVDILVNSPTSNSLHKIINIYAFVSVKPQYYTVYKQHLVLVHSIMRNMLGYTIILCISKDLPFAQARFCGAEGIDNVEMLSDFRDGNFGKNYEVDFSDGPLAPLHSRAVVVIDEDGKIRYTEQVSEITEEPNYKAALASLMH